MNRLHRRGAALMPRFLLLAVSLALIAAFLPAAPVPRDAEKALYFPIHVGTKWVYDENGKKKFEETVTAVEKKNERYLVTVATIDHQAQEATFASQYEVSSAGIFKVADGLEAPETSTKFDPPHCVLKLPHKVGEKWDEGEDDGPIVAGKMETVKVPAGTFEAIRLDRGKRYTWWFAVSYGMVKYRTGDFTYEMKSFTLPKE